MAAPPVFGKVHTQLFRQGIGIRLGKDGLLRPLPEGDECFRGAHPVDRDDAQTGIGASGAFTNKER